LSIISGFIFRADFLFRYKTAADNKETNGSRKDAKKRRTKEGKAASNNFASLRLSVLAPPA
jgi:hypothetical protein